ncbi:uncharacterized protein LOC143459699 [Clavelina lepadiformis]|uniref:uncharacterized protein LOC143459699 n=1 Tax=Clavelina lepadiformis TaxID=159417 RepID=UPI00404384A4
MTNIGLRVIILVVIAVLFRFARSEFLSRNGPHDSDCKREPNRSKVVHLGWPLLLACHLVHHNEYEYPSNYTNIDYDGSAYDEGNTGYQETTFTCLIWDLDNNQLLINASGTDDFLVSIDHRIENLTEGHSRHYQIERWNSEGTACTIGFLQLNVTQLPEVQCKEAMKDSTISINHYSQLYDRKLFGCTVPGQNLPPMEALMLKNYSAKWYHNCGPLPKGAETGKSDTEWESLSLSSLEWHHPGTYTCAVSYNGMTRHVINHKLCVKAAVPLGDHSVRCSKKTYKVSLNQRAEVECYVNPGYKKTHGIYYEIFWKKDEGKKDSPSMQCEEHMEDPGTEENKNARKRCWFNMRDEMCYHKTPNHEERLLNEELINIKFVIDNFAQEDTGTYVLSFKIANRTATERVHLSENHTSELVNASIICGVVIAIIALDVLITLLIWWKLVYVKIFWKRKFSSYVPDDKKYGAFLSYHFSTEIDKFAQHQARDAVAAVRSEMEILGYKIYDEHKNGYDLGLRTELTVASMRQSHRVVILLTSEYLKDHWNVYTLHKGFEDMINSKTKLIFILVPGIREYIKQHGAHDDTCRVISRAIKINKTIDWSGDENFNSKLFSMQIELAMPKLRSQYVSRHDSTSTTGSSKQIKYKNGYKRTLSNETRITQLSSISSVTSENLTELFNEDKACKESSVV